MVHLQHAGTATLTMVSLVPSLLWLTVIVQLQCTMQDRLPREDHLRTSTPTGSEVADVGSVTSSGDGASSSQLFEPRDHPNWQLFEHEQCGASLSDRIIGGEKADLGAFPWIARIGYTSLGECHEGTG
ncbi:uncharacterized protein LOC134527303 [Bacillus rossius redtenbacheri]|uniref:uncharacterized protein LOC134527303 n=1 Tax=Bacillus rossius redtenbacheri TaxID=93214 RepID=UPI002FDE9303